MKINKKVIIYIILITTSILWAIPFIVMVLTSLLPNNTNLMDGVSTWISDISLENYKNLFANYPIGLWTMNSIIVSIFAVTGEVIISAMAGYVFARMDFKYKEIIFAAYLATMLIPMQVLMIPQFLTISNLNLTNTYAALILPSLFNAFSVFLFRQFFITLPKDIEEAAFMDGANHITIFFKLILPMSKTAIATVSIFSFMNAWNAYLWPLIVTNSQDMMTLPLGLARMQGQYLVDWGLMMAGTLISVVPIILIYLFAQKYFVASIASTGGKE